MKISLIGFMGCGKTTVGKLLSEKLCYTFIDIDKEIEKVIRLSIPDIFENFGENFFRRKEREILVKVLENDNIIISTGGGLPTVENNIKTLNDKTITVYLKTDFNTLWKRIEKDTTRPLVKFGKIKSEQLLKIRKPFYEKAEIIVETDNKTPEQIASEILEKLNKV